MSAFLLSSLDSNSSDFPQCTTATEEFITTSSVRLTSELFVLCVCLCVEVWLLDVSVFLTDEVVNEVVIKLPPALADRPP